MKAEITLDLDLYKSKKALGNLQNTLEFLRSIPDVEIYKRASSSGKGMHIKVYIPLPEILTGMNRKEFFFLARYLLGDDIHRIDADINRWLTTQEERSVMVLFEEKFIDGEWKKCGEWKRV